MPDSWQVAVSKFDRTAEWHGWEDQSQCVFLSALLERSVDLRRGEGNARRCFYVRARGHTSRVMRGKICVAERHSRSECKGIFTLPQNLMRLLSRPSLLIALVFCIVSARSVPTAFAIEWVKKTPIRSDLSGITFAQGTYVSVGDQSGLYTATLAGEEWARRDVEGETFLQLKDVATNGTAFVTLGASFESEIVIFYSQNPQDASKWFQQEIIPAPEPGEEMNSVSWVNGQFWGAGRPLSIWSSDDGADWITEHASDFDGDDCTQALQGIAFGNGKYVAVGRGQAVLTALEDHLTWSEINCGNHLMDVNFYDIAFGNDTFVAVGSEATGQWLDLTDGTILTSPDGNNWTDRHRQEGGRIWSVTFGKGRFVAAGSGGRIYTSINGFDWTEVLSPTTASIRQVRFLPFNGVGEFAAVGVHGVIMTSADGLDWKLRSGFASDAEGIHDLTAITYLPDRSRFLAVGGNGIVLDSPDGVEWEPRDSGTAARLADVTEADGFIVAVGENGTILASSDGGESWSEKSAPSSADEVDLADVAYGDGHWVAVGNNGENGYIFRASSSAGGWVEVERYPGKKLNGVAYGDGKFIAGGGPWRETFLLSSSDGSSWQDLGQSDLGTSVWEVEFTPDGFVALGDPHVLISSNGTDWTKHSTGSSYPLEGIATDGDQYVLTAGQSTLMTSADGEAWTREELGIDGYTLYDVAFGGGMFVVIGDYGLILHGIGEGGGDDDADGDGLTAAEEVTHGTNPNDPDSDDDDLNDGDEVNLHETDPTDPDSDNDGLEDGEEVNQHQTDPKDSDSDGDGVSDGTEVESGTDPKDPKDPDDTPDCPPPGGEWHNGHYYMVVTEEMTWDEARAHAESLSCAEFIAHLVVLDSQAENDFVDGLTGRKGISGASWIGCSDVAEEGEWRWVTGGLVDDGFTAWASQEPNDSGGEDFGEIEDGEWNDEGESDTRGFTVEFEPGTGELRFVFEILGSSNSPTLRVTNRSSGTLNITALELTIGDAAFNFDAVDEIETPAGVEIVVGSPDANGDGGVRSDLVRLDFTGFGSGKTVSFGTDIDRDHQNSTEDYRDVLFNNGAAPNAIVTAFSGNGKCSVTLPDAPNESSYRFDCESVTADRDADGLSDAEEFTHGTDPGDPDSDDDGLSDGEEVNDHQTNPTEFDSDGDGVGDGTEVASGTDPRDPADTPECPPPGGAWFNGHYYLVVTDEMSWQDAKAHADSLSCTGFTARLVTLETEAESEFVADLARAKGIPRASWIGCTDVEVEGEWRWITGELVSNGYEGWYPTQPSNSDGNEHFGEIGWHTQSSWNDAPGDAPHGFTVEFEPASDCPPPGGEWHNGHYYLVVTDEMNWEEARMHAESLGCGDYSAHLVTLESASENTFVGDLTRAKGIPRASWIGCSDVAVEGEWRWVTGSLVSDAFEGWNEGTGEPSNSGGDEHFAEIGWHSKYTWNDGDGVGPQGFTVEFEPGGDDRDNDGLTDAEENEYGTDPDDPDSDDDALSDGEEVKEHQTDPTDPDSDDDGLDDGEEVDDYGTNPRNPDSDNDGISDGGEISRGTKPDDPGDTPDCGPIGSPNVIGQWDFNGGDLSATAGTPLEYLSDTTRNGTAFLSTGNEEVGHIDDQAAEVMKVPDLENSEDGYRLELPAMTNGGGSEINQWTLIMDVYYPSASSGEYRSLIQVNDGDGDLFINPGNGIGVSGDYDGEVMPNEWHRIGFVVDGGNEMRKFIDGIEVGSQSAGDLDGRWALRSGQEAILFGDDSGEVKLGYVNSIQLRSDLLSPDDMAVLGGATSTGIARSSSKSDSDCDGLSDEEEQLLGTGEFDPDSDDDGVNDGTELASGTDPTDPLSKPGGVSDFVVTDIRFVDNDVEVSFPTELGRFYQLQTSQDLRSWQDDAFEFGGTGDILTLGVGNALVAKERYYRVRERVE